MKNKFLILSLLFVSFLLVGCPIQNNQETSSSNRTTSSQVVFNEIGTWKPYKNVNGSRTEQPSTEEKKYTMVFSSNSRFEWKHPSFVMIKGTYTINSSKTRITINNTGGGILHDSTITLYIDNSDIYWQDSNGTKQYFSKV